MGLGRPLRHFSVSSAHFCSTPAPRSVQEAGFSAAVASSRSLQTRFRKTFHRFPFDFACFFGVSFKRRLKTGKLDETSLFTCFHEGPDFENASENQSKIHACTRPAARLPKNSASEPFVVPSGGLGWSFGMLGASPGIMGAALGDSRSVLGPCREALRRRPG